MNLSPSQAVTLIWPWVKHYMLGSMAITFALIIIGLQEFITSPYPWYIKLLGFLGWCQVAFRGMQYVAGGTLALVFLVTGQWKQFSAIMNGDK